MRAQEAYYEIYYKENYYIIYDIHSGIFPLGMQLI